MSDSLKGLILVLLFSSALAAAACAPAGLQAARPAESPDPLPAGRMDGFQAAVPKKIQKAAGPYSQAVIAGNLVFTSGQLPLDPAGKALPGGIEAQTVQALENLRALLERAGSSMDNVVKVTVFLRNLNDLGTVNSICDAYFKGSYPARTCVQAARISRDALIEIEAVGLIRAMKF